MTCYNLYVYIIYYTSILAPSVHECFYCEKKNVFGFFIFFGFYILYFFWVLLF